MARFRKFGGLLFATALVASACSSGGTATTAPAASQAASQAAASAAHSVAGKKEYNIALIRWEAGDIFFNGVQYGEEQAIKDIEAANGVKINFKVVAANDAAKQLDGLRALMAQGIDGVSLVPWQGPTMTDVIKELLSKNIPVVVHNIAAPDSAAPFVAQDNTEAGALAGQAILKDLEDSRGADWGKDGGVILMLRGDINNSFDAERAAGYHSVLDQLKTKFPNVQIIERANLGYQAEPARTAVGDAITRYGIDKILAIGSVDGTMAVGGAIPAIQAAGGNVAPGSPNRIPVTSMDCSKPELDSIARNELAHCSEQPAVVEGILVQTLLWDMMSHGTITPSKGVENVADWNGKPWAPVTIASNPTFPGPWYKTKPFSVPETVPVESDFHWANAGVGGN